MIQLRVRKFAGKSSDVRGQCSHSIHNTYNKICTLHSIIILLLLLLLLSSLLLLLYNNMPSTHVARQKMRLQCNSHRIRRLPDVIAGASADAAVHCYNNMYPFFFFTESLCIRSKELV